MQNEITFGSDDTKALTLIRLYKKGLMDADTFYAASDSLINQTSKDTQQLLWSTVSNDPE